MDPLTAHILITTRESGAALTHKGFAYAAMRDAYLVLVAHHSRMEAMWERAIQAAVRRHKAIFGGTNET